MLTYEFPHGGGVLIGADDDSDINLFRATTRRREDENKNEAGLLSPAPPATAAPGAQIAQNPGMLALHFSVPINIVAQVVSRGQR